MRNWPDLQMKTKTVKARREGDKDKEKIEVENIYSLTESGKFFQEDKGAQREQDPGGDDRKRAPLGQGETRAIRKEK